LILGQLVFDVQTPQITARHLTVMGRFKRTSSTLYALKVPPKVIAGIMRHDPLTSWKYYIDTPSEDSVKAMDGIEEWFTAAEESSDDSQ
jgi:hypothetical protein